MIKKDVTVVITFEGESDNTIVLDAIRYAEITSVRHVRINDTKIIEMRVVSQAEVS